MGSTIYFIQGNNPALKSSKQWTGRYLVQNKRVTEYLKLHGIKSYSSRRKEVIHLNKSQSDYEFRKVVEKIKEELQSLTPPYKIGFHFVRKSKHKFDFGNAYELLADLFTAYNIWEDDNMDYFLPFPLEVNNKYYTFNKDNPGVLIQVL